ncbi:hypothetical protein EJ06DRAFT_394826 [Trichodelitschia bisporula]|uniref:Ubiquitin-activating enzyme E1-like n=1 Tax=Trichodelitschia bisporula TaxID=703511 RepID=A0A6G1I030_9PEZI|nr:hypothetical protein EJ06DRAFT_394826 [Trichodelitschia bisporula]
MGRRTYYQRAFGLPLAEQIRDSRVLLVGAGGIGCELLKNLTLSGFGDVTVVDLDTIDLSNLNRQFLFRREHIKKSKALIAKESAGKFNPEVKITALHDDIKSLQFDVNWFRGFTVIFNALDNLDARRHVNRMCIAANVPLVESGTTGFEGNVQAIKRGITECYDCTQKETPKTFPVCTIRSTPSQLIHCIVWAKSYLLTELFGVSEAMEALAADTEGDADEIKNLKGEAELLRQVVSHRDSDNFSKEVFTRVFSEDIKRLRDMKDMWKSRAPPTPLPSEFGEQEKLPEDGGDALTQQDQRIWSPWESYVAFDNSIRRLQKRFLDGETVIEFDKDDVDTLDFVVASANLRAHVFGIKPQSKFTIKQMAGNIIPAIATTNAIVAGLCVLEGLKVLRGDIHKAPMVFTNRSADKSLSAERVVRPPNRDCHVCSVARMLLFIYPKTATLGLLVKDVLIRELGYSDFSVMNGSGIIYERDSNFGEEDDEEWEDNLNKTFGQFGLKEMRFITIHDLSEDEPRVDLELAVVTRENFSFSIELQEQVEIPKRPVPPVSAHGMTNGATNGITNDAANGATNGITNGPSNGSANKRKRDLDDDDGENGAPVKRTKDMDLVDDGQNQAPVIRTKGIVLDEPILDDTHNGAIFIDDD